MSNNPFNNPNLIPGVFNYCDRWCERCPLTSRCLTFITLNDCLNKNESKDNQNRKFWEKLNELYDTTYNMMDKFIPDDEEDLFPEPDDEEKAEIMKQQEDIDNKVEENECNILSQKYSNQVMNWFEKNEKLLNEKENALKNERTDLPSKNPYLEAFDLKDAADIILYYGFFISAKVNRALHGLFDECEEEFDDMPKDSDGSAKIGLIAIDRSIAAWGEIYYRFPEQEVIEFVLLLDKLKRLLELSFPNAKNFIRPGFDE
ncbi:MAG: hypothetical protein C4539_16945 [Ignavibacteriales bacterium]|nr:MAG: hypothetical protein C4539_16945 [Ignavibacteriales bacterium]